MKSELVYQLTETFEGHAQTASGVEHWLVQDHSADVGKMVDLGFGQKSREKNNIYQSVDMRRRRRAPMDHAPLVYEFHCSLEHFVLHIMHIRPLRVRCAPRNPEPAEILGLSCFRAAA